MKIHGNKTFAIAIGIVGYIVVSVLTGNEPDQNVINTLLGGGLFTLRHGMKKNGGT